MSPQRQRTPSNEASPSENTAASSTANVELRAFLKPELTRPAPRGLDHLGRDVRRDQASAGAQQRHGEEARVTPGPDARSRIVSPGAG